MRKSCLLLVLLLSLNCISCKKKKVHIDGSLIADGIQTLCIWGKYDEALLLYNKYLASYERKNDYLQSTTALSLFSNTNQKELYFEYLKRAIKYNTNFNAIEGYTNDEFYNRFEQIIKRYYQDIPRERINKTDSLIIEDYLFKDQEIRRKRELTIEKDSMIQIPIKELIAGKKYNNNHIDRALYLLLRHASPSYLIEYKESGLLNHYASLGIITKEEYYSAVRYKSKTFPSVQTDRKTVGLLPREYSTFIISQKAILNNYDKPSADKTDSLSAELLNYIYTETIEKKK